MVNVIKHISVLARQETASARWVRLGIILAAASVVLALSGCASSPRPRYGHRMYISVPDQKMIVLKESRDPEIKGGKRLTYITEYPVSTSKFGLGSRNGSNATPLGKHVIAKKIGGGVPLYAKFKSRRPTGEIVPPNTPGRDAIVTRIMWLRGLEPQNMNSYSRFIYIHGTAEEKMIGKPASYGCIRMKSTHVAQLYNLVSEKDEVTIVNKRLNPAAYLPPPTAPAMQQPMPAQMAPPAMGPPKPHTSGGPTVRNSRKPTPPLTATTPQEQHKLPSGISENRPSGNPDPNAVATPDLALAGTGNPTWVPPDRATAKYYRRGVNAKRLFQ